MLLSDLPPCIEKLIEDKNLAVKYANLLVAFFKTYGDIQDIKKYIDDESLANLIISIGSTTNQKFSCEFVQMYLPDLCDQKRCKIFAAKNPLDFLVEKFKRAVYNKGARTLSIYFEGNDRPLTINLEEVVTNRGAILNNIYVYTLETFGVPIKLTKVKNSDTGMVVDTLEELIKFAYSNAVHVEAEDPDGILETILMIINNNQIVPRELASVITHVFVYERDGKKYLAVKTRTMMRAASIVIGGGRKKIREILMKYGIVKKQIRLNYDRDYYYLIPDELVKKATDMTIDELLQLHGSVDFEKEIDELLKEAAAQSDDEGEEDGGGAK